MSSRSFILLPGQTAWRFVATDSDASAVVELPVETDATRTECAAAAASALQSNGCSGGIVLAIPSDWCLCAPISTKDLPSRNRQQAMTYRLEDQLPVAAEDLVAAFVPYGVAEDETLGVCAHPQELAPLVEAMESKGLAVTAICPAALLVLQHFIETGFPNIAAADAIVWPSDHPGMLELCILRNGRLRAWYLLPDAPADLLQHLIVEFRGIATRRSIVAIDLAPVVFEAISSHPQFDVTAADCRNRLNAAAKMAGSIATGKSGPWIDLRRGSLAAKQSLRQVRTQLTFATVAVVIFLLSLCGAMLRRANQLDQISEGDSEKQQAIFQRTFPTETIPVDVLSRLQAEQRGLHGLVGDSSSLPPQANGMLMLRDLLMHLPTGEQPRYRVLELRLDSGNFSLEGEASAHGDADLISVALRRGGEFKVESPRTEQLGSAGSEDASGQADKGKNGVSFTITGISPTALPELGK